MSPVIDGVGAEAHSGDESRGWLLPFAAPGHLLVLAAAPRAGIELHPGSTIFG